MPSRDLVVDHFRKTRASANNQRFGTTAKILPATRTHTFLAEFTSSETSKALNHELGHGRKSFCSIPHSRTSGSNHASSIDSRSRDPAPRIGDETQVLSDQPGEE